MSAKFFVILAVLAAAQACPLSPCNNNPLVVSSGCASGPAVVVASPGCCNGFGPYGFGYNGFYGFNGFNGCNGFNNFGYGCGCNSPAVVVPNTCGCGGPVVIS